jgi:hypothetical protein
LLGIANDFAPRWVKRRGNTEFPENGIGLGIFVREGVAGQMVMGQEFLLCHDLHSIVKGLRKTRLVRFARAEFTGIQYGLEFSKIQQRLLQREWHENQKDSTRNQSY